MQRSYVQCMAMKCGSCSLNPPHKRTLLSVAVATVSQLLTALQQAASSSLLGCDRCGKCSCCIQVLKCTRVSHECTINPCRSYDESYTSCAAAHTY
jgi:hypothetical protein